MIDLVALPYMVEVFVCISHGNIAKSIVTGAVWFSLGLIIATQFAPIFTEVAVGAGFQLSQPGVYIMSMGIMCHPLLAGLFLAFLSQNPILIALVVVIYIVLYVWFKKFGSKLVDFLENYGMEEEEAAA